MLYVKRVIEKLRSKGYDDFYLADLVNKYDYYVMFFTVIIIPFIVAGIPVLAYNLMTGNNGFHFYRDIPTIFVLLIMGTSISALLIGICSIIPAGTIWNAKDNGETDLRLKYIVGSFFSKLCLKLMRFAPIVSVVLLIIVLVVSLIMGGLHWETFLAFGISLALLLMSAPKYYKCYNRVLQEAKYYADWKTNQDVEHFEELVSGHEKWWRPSAELDFEKQNIDRYRSIRVAAAAGTIIFLFAGFICGLAFTPIVGTYEEERISVNNQETSSLEATDASLQIEEEDVADNNSVEYEDEEAAVTGDELEEGDAESDEELVEEAEEAEEVEQLGDWQTAEIDDIQGYAWYNDKPTPYSKRLRYLDSGTPLRCREVLDNQEGKWYKIYSMDNEFYGYIRASELKIK